MVVESVVLIVAIILAVLVFLRFIPLNLWISALASGVHVSIFTLMGMRIRRVPPAKIVGPLIKAEKAGLNMQISKMEAHFLAGMMNYFHFENFHLLNLLNFLYYPQYLK